MKRRSKIKQIRTSVMVLMFKELKSKITKNLKTQNNKTSRENFIKKTKFLHLAAKVTATSLRISHLHSY